MKLVVSCGDVGGIGLETFYKALPLFYTKHNVEVALCVNKKALIKYYSVFDFDFDVVGDFGIVAGNKFKIIECDNYAEPLMKKADKNAGLLSIESIEKATKAVLENEYNALVTLPINKESAYFAGLNFPGHTEFLAYICNSNSPIMILFHNNLRVALATTHIPIKNVSALLSVDSIFNKIVQLDKIAKQDFCKISPKIAVLGLNPHAGENGSIGTEELDIIEPAINKAKEIGINCSGAYPADAFFARRSFNNFDIILAMYHDQGLIPLKYIAGEGGVNFTAGLSIVRTSPDHGTAFDIAGKNIASHISLLESMEEAVNISMNRAKN